MLKVVLYQPEIPPNTGNAIRLCANAGASLHLIEPLGFSLDDRQLRRAGMDYGELTDVRVYPTYQDFLSQHPRTRVFAFSTSGDIRYSDVNYGEGDALLFGPETRGLPRELLQTLPREQRLRIPMTPAARSVNLSNTVAIAVYEAWRQLSFAGGG